MLRVSCASRRLIILALIAICGLLLVASDPPSAARAAVPAAPAAAQTPPHSIYLPVIGQQLAYQAPARAETPAAAQESMTFYAVADTFVRSSAPDATYGSETTLELSYDMIEAAEEVALVRFDLSGLPSGAVIDTAAMELYLTGAAGTTLQDVLIYYVTSSWAEASVTYNSFPTIQPDFPLGASVDSVTGQYKTWWINTWAQYWQAHPDENFGVMLRRFEEDIDFYDRVFESREAANQRPRLDITYHFCYALALTHTGSGSNPVATPASSNGCPAGQYVAGESITLSASPSANWTVSSWSGTNNDSSTSTTNAVTMPAASHVAGVNYTPISPTCYPLTLAHAGSGNDPVATPGSSAGCAAGQYVAGELITLNASPAVGWTVGNWSGTNNNSSTATTNAVTMPAAAHSAGVSYVALPPPCYTLTRTHTGTGNDPVADAANSPGCAAGKYIQGQYISLEAWPGGGWKVGSWSGTMNDASAEIVNSLTMPGGNHTVSVNYVAVPPTCYALTRTHTGSGSDPVATPGNSPGCSAGHYTAGAYIDLTASPSPGWEVSGWSGTASDGSKSSSNWLNMPAAKHAVNVAYQSALKTITFEENIPLPNTVDSQYCNGATTNWGVRFPSLPRISMPFTYLALGGEGVALASPYRALYSTLAPVTGKQIVASFTAPQHYVTVMVGLDRAYSAAVTAHLEAYSSPTPSASTLVDSELAVLGKGPVDVTQPLAVSASLPTIRSVVVDFTSSVPVAEVIDNLAFTQIGPPCTNDTTAPTVQITAPAIDGVLIQGGKQLLAFTASDAETGIAKVRISYLDASAAELEGFSVCTSYMPCTSPDPKSQQGQFYTSVAAGTHTVRVEAWDFADHKGQALRKVEYTATGPNLNLWALGMEVTQVTQDWIASSTTSRSGTAPSIPFSASAVPMVQGKKTVVRVYPGVEGTGQAPVLGVTAQLTCADANGQPCSGQQFAALSSEVTADPAYANDLNALRSQAARTLNFVLPDAWTKMSGAIRLTAKVSAASWNAPECSGCADGANSMSITNLVFQQTAPLQLHLVWACVRRSASDPVTTCDTSPLTIHQQVFQPAGSLFGLTMPVAQPGIQLTLHSPQTVPFDGDFNLPNADMTSPRMYAFHSQMCTLATQEANGGTPPINRIHFGIVPSPVTAILGLGNTNCSIAKIDPVSLSGDIKTSTEEVGHALGRPHASCDHDEGGCEAAPAVFPCTHGGICTYGFDTTAMKVIEPGNTSVVSGHTHDFMSYGANPWWVSPYTYRALFNQMVNAPKVGAAETGAPQPVIWIGGSIAADDGVTLQPPYHMLQASVPHDPGNGAYSVELQNAGGSALITRFFAPEVLTGDPPDPDYVAPARFYLALPYPAQTARLVIKHGAAILLTRERTTHAPVVSITQPAAGTDWSGQGPYPVAWSATDADADDPLWATVQYSVDGGKAWATLTSDRTAKSLQVDSANLAGSGSALIRVLASDGFNTGIGVSGSFRVGTKPPQAWITSPQSVQAADVTYAEGALIVLGGNAADLEDGPLPGTALAWSSDRDGRLGEGHRLDVTTLSPGAHTITLTATDSGGRTAAASITVRVTAHVNSQPVANAGPDPRVSTGEIVYLDGRGSHDADGDALVYEWVPVDSGAYSFGHCPEPAAAYAPFWASVAGDYTLALTVYDGSVSSAPDTVTVHVTGGPPSRLYLPSVRR